MAKKKTFKKEVEVVEKTIEDLVEETIEDLVEETKEEVEETVEKAEETKEEVEIIDEPVSSVSAGAEFIEVEGKVGTFLSINGKTPVKINDKAEVRRLVEHYSATAQNVAPYTFIIKRV
jgi:uncharacterized protein with von Willebrand factor type A (vWA) domain